MDHSHAPSPFLFSGSNAFVLTGGNRPPTGANETPLSRGDPHRKAVPGSFDEVRCVQNRFPVSNFYALSFIIEDLAMSF